MKQLRLLTAGLLLTTGCSLMSRPSEEQAPPPPPPLPLNDPALSAPPVGAPPAPPPPPPPELAPAAPNEAFKLPDTMKRTKNAEAGKDSAGMTVTLTNSKGETINAAPPTNMVGGESMKSSAKKDPSITEIKPAPSLAPLSPPEGAVITDTPMPSSDDNEKLHHTAPAASAQSVAVVVGVPAEKALGWLKNGNRRFVRHKLRNDGQSKKDIARLVNEQHPHAMVFSPGDSRIPPEIIFDQKLGEIYVVRANVGVTLDFVRKNVESTVRDLGVNLVVFLNSDGIKDPLLAQSEYLRSREKDNGLKIVEAEYDLASGAVNFR